MQTHEIAVLAVAAAGVVAAIVWTLYSGLRTRWPSGQRLDVRVPATADTHEVRLYAFLAKGIKAESMGGFTQAAGSAVWAAAVAWKVARDQRRVTKDDSPTHEVVVIVETAEAMEAKAEAWGYQSVAGYIDRLKLRSWGSATLPMIVISELHVAEVINTGEPVIHEMMHALERDYVGGTDDHSNPVVWAAARTREGTTRPSVQEIARKVYLGKATG